MDKASKHYVAYVTYTWEPKDDLYRQTKLVMKDCSDEAEAKAAIDAWSARLTHDKKLMRHNVEVLHLTTYENGRFGEPLPDVVVQIGISRFYEQAISRSGVPEFGQATSTRQYSSSSKKDFMTDAVIEQLGGAVAL